MIFDIYKVQLGKLIYESVNEIGPTNKVIIYTRASEMHKHNTRYAENGNFYTSVSKLPVLDLENCKYKVNTYGKNYPTISKVVER